MRAKHYFYRLTQKQREEYYAEYPELNFIKIEKFRDSDFWWMDIPVPFRNDFSRFLRNKYRHERNTK